MSFIIIIFSNIFDKEKHIRFLKEEQEVNSFKDAYNKIMTEPNSI